MEAEKLERDATKAIGLKVQFKDFGKRDPETGDWLCTRSQVDLLEEVCREAAQAAIKVCMEAAAKVADPIEPCGQTDYEKQAFDLRQVIATAIRALSGEQ